MDISHVDVLSETAAPGLGVVKDQRYPALSDHETLRFGPSTYTIFLAKSLERSGQARALAEAEVNHQGWGDDSVGKSACCSSPRTRV